MESVQVVNRVPTRFLCFGRELHESAADVKVAVIVIPGNPGTIEYYREFMESLHQQLKDTYQDSTVPVWGISHAGHQNDNLQLPLPSLNENTHLYNLRGQINHKMEFLTELVPKHVRLILIGHSIGCKITLEILKEFQDAQIRILKCFMLFPTIERMAVTPNGKFLSRLSPFAFLLTPLLWSLSLLPTSVHRRIVDFHFWVAAKTDVHDCVRKAGAQLCQKGVLDRVITMGYDELRTVVDLDEGCVGQHLEKLFFYFGTTDDWCPLDYVKDMQAKFPDLEHQVCEVGMKHAFVLEHGLQMADYLHPKICTYVQDHV